MRHSSLVTLQKKRILDFFSKKKRKEKKGIASKEPIVDKRSG
jgi:hypothetical protein